MMMVMITMMVMMTMVPGRGQKFQILISRFNFWSASINDAINSNKNDWMTTVFFTQMGSCPFILSFHREIFIDRIKISKGNYHLTDVAKWMLDFYRNYYYFILISSRFMNSLESVFILFENWHQSFCSLESLWTTSP